MDEIQKLKKENLKAWAEKFLYNRHTAHRTPYSIAFTNYTGYPLDEPCWCLQDCDHDPTRLWAYDVCGECSKCGRIDYRTTFPRMEQYVPLLEEMI